MNTILDFGNISYGVTYTKLFPIKNTSDHPIKVSNLGQSCTCVQVSMSGNSTIGPGEQTNIKVMFTPGSTGVVQRSFWFRLNDVDSYTITVKGYVS